MERQPVSSSAIASVGWVEDGPGSNTGVLEVEFRRGGQLVYQYPQVTKKEYEDILQAGSAGHAVNCSVLGRCGGG